MKPLFITPTPILTIRIPEVLFSSLKVHLTRLVSLPQQVIKFPVRCSERNPGKRSTRIVSTHWSAKFAQALYAGISIKHWKSAPHQSTTLLFSFVTYSSCILNSFYSILGDRTLLCWSTDRYF